MERGNKDKETTTEKNKEAEEEQHKYQITDEIKYRER